MSIGETLAQARRDSGLTLAQVSENTRIRETVIRCIEADDYSLCGGNFYARGHIRSICRAIGFDPEPLVRDYDDAHGGAPAAISVATAFEPERPVQFRERRSPNWSAAMAAALALVFVYGVVRVFGGGSSHPAERVNLAEAPPAATQTAAPKKPERKDAVALAGRSEVTVRLKASRSAWVLVKDAKGKQLYSGLISVGDVKQWTAKKEILVIVGSGARMAFTVNGRAIGTPGKAGKVLRLTFGPGDPGKN
ncbi:MAG: helix-turn-helix domain-containing protein [Streptosporangiaceae bacterium]